MNAYFSRAINPLILNALKQSPAVYLNGPRQVGKSTLAHKIAEQVHADYLSFDDISLLSAAQSDPQHFVKQFKKAVVIDEVQMAPEIFLGLKQQVDNLRLEHKVDSYGRFLFTGSVNIMALPKLSKALVGRVHILTLLPLSISEALGSNVNLVQSLFYKSSFSSHKLGEEYTLENLIHKATFPELVSNPAIQANSWFQNYYTTLLQREVQQLAHIEKLSSMPLLLKTLAYRVGSLLNDSDLARDTGLNLMTFRRYRTLLEQVFLIKFVPPWFRNFGKRLVKSSKIYFNDTALLCSLLPQQNVSFLKDTQNRLYSMVLENFVMSELSKCLCLLSNIQLYHFRTQDGKEIDFILEDNEGNIVAIEVKARGTVQAKDFQTIHFLQAQLGKDNVKGIVLYLGAQSLSFGENCYAMPLSAFWVE